MPAIKGVAHFSIAVSDPEKSIKFYTEVVGCKLLHAQPSGKITFLDAGGVCLLLIKRPAPIHKGPPEMSDGVHHAFMLDADEYQSAVDGLRARHRRAARLLPGSGRHDLGIHQPHCLCRAAILTARPHCRAWRMIGR
jgi:catechol 2,3-dioxygenase-like lactoylglutathione lyase family enzyme